jgi:hypothetical protein
MKSAKVPRIVAGHLGACTMAQAGEGERMITRAGDPLGARQCRPYHQACSSRWVR